MAVPSGPVLPSAEAHSSSLHSVLRLPSSAAGLRCGFHPTQGCSGTQQPGGPIGCWSEGGESTLKTYSGNLWKKTRERREERERGEREEREIDRERGPERCDKKLFAKLAMVIMLHNVVNHPNLWICCCMLLPNRDLARKLWGDSLFGFSPEVAETNLSPCYRTRGPERWHSREIAPR